MVPSTRVVKADDALRCCKSAEARLNGDISRIIGQFLRAILTADGETQDIVYTEDPVYGIEIGLATSQESVSAGVAPTVIGLGLAGARSVFDALLEGPVRTVAPGIVDDFGRIIRQPSNINRPVPSTGPPIVGPVITGAVVLVSALEVAQIAGTIGALNAVSALAGAIGQATGKRKQTHCDECLERALLSQSRPRKRVEASILRRV